MRELKSDIFIHDDFLLNSNIAKQLYHDFAKNCPIIDYHNHLSAKQIAENQPLNNITDTWLEGDHYKWRSMRANGVDEQFITGSASKEEKFTKWAETVPYTIKNPLFHWTHLELKRYFGLDSVLQPSTAKSIYNQVNAQLATKTPANLLEAMQVEVICTTDDPVDDLKHHKHIANLNIPTKVYPTFRPDKLILIKNPTYSNYINSLETSVGFSITCLDDLLQAIKNRIDYFHEQGCRISDYGLSQLFTKKFTKKEANAVFKKGLSSKKINSSEQALFASYLLYHLCKMYSKKGWVQQFHLGAIRNNNEQLLQLVGADSGCDSIGDFKQAQAMSKLFNKLNNKGALTKTITYNLDPALNHVFATMMGNYSEANSPGKMQWGAGWWFLDQKNGIENHIQTLSNVGLLSRFVGMLTDSRSFLSFPRHEYFRRILCNVLANDIIHGEVPNDIHFVGEIVKNICYNNAKEYFNFNKP